jgi:two-component system nitrate/nitrite response regulator NarP
MTRILMADDHPFIMSGVEAVLRDAGYEVVGKTPDGTAFLEALAAARPDILILDVQMPERDGIDVLLTLRSRGDTRPIVLLTADLDDRRLLEAIKGGVSGIVLKEGAEATLVECLSSVSKGKRWIDKALLERALNVTIDGTPQSDPLGALTTREKAIASLIAQGLRNREVASELGLTEGTVKVYLHNMYVKLGVENRTELAVLAAATHRR